MADSKVYLHHNGSYYAMNDATLIYCADVDYLDIPDNWTEVDFDRIDPALADYCLAIQQRLSALERINTTLEDNFPLDILFEAFTEASNNTAPQTFTQE